MKNAKKTKILLNIVGVLGFIGLWQMLVVIKRDPTLISADRIGKALVEILVSEKFKANLFSTLKILIIGIGISAVFGIGLAVLMDYSNTLRQLLIPLIEIFRNIPSITLFPILLVVYGIGDMSRIFVIFWTSCPSILLSAMYGLRSVSKEVIEAGMLDADGWQILTKIKLPLSVPEILNGIKIGIGNGFVAIVVAEMLGATRGIGFMVLWTTNAFKYAETYAYIIIIGLIGIAFNSVMELIIQKCEKEFQ